MSGFGMSPKLKNWRRIGPGGGGGVVGGGLLTPTFDNRYGTDTVGAATTGKFRFALKAGRVRTFVDSVNGDDGTGDGLTPATAYATVEEAWPQHISGYVAGDQFCMAGGEGQVYEDPGDLTWWRDSPGFSATFPHAVLSYDSRDPTNEALYGWAPGAAMPILDIATTGTPFLSAGGSAGTNWFAVQGLRLRSIDPDIGSPNLLFYERHDGVVFQHVTTERVTITHQNADAGNRTDGINFSMFSQAGQWSSGGNIGVLIGNYVDNARIENVHSFHVGWKLAADRNATNALGGANFLSHNFYCFVANGEITAQRTLNIMSSFDGDNYRCAHSSAVNVGIRVPVPASVGGFSGAQAELLGGGGIIGHRKDDLFIDSTYIDDASDGEGNGGPGGWAYAIGCAVAGSTVDNALLLNSSQAAVPSSGVLIRPQRQDGESVEYAFPTAVAFSRITSVGWANDIQRDGNGNMANFTATWTNCDTDILLPGVGNVLSSGVIYTNEMTNKEIYDAILDLVNVAAGGTEDQSLGKIVNLIHHRPDLAGAFSQAFVDVCYPAYNKTKTYASASLPDLSAETPADIFNGPTNPAASYTPADAPGIAYWYENDPATAFSDAGVTPAADTGTVQQWGDKGPNNWPLVQATGANRFVWHNPGGGVQPYLKSDGVNDGMNWAAAHTVSLANGTFWLAVAVAPDDWFQGYIAHLHGAHYFGTIDNHIDPPEAISYDNTETPTADPASSSVVAAVPHVFMMQVTPTTVELFIDNVSAGSTALSGTRVAENAVLYLASLIGVAFWHAAKYYGVAGGLADLSGPERAELNDYMAALWA